MSLHAQILYECRSRTNDTVVFVLGTCHRLPKDVKMDTALLARLMSTSEIIFSEMYIDDGDTSYKRISAELSNGQRFRNNGVLSDSVTKSEYDKLLAYYRRNYGISTRQLRWVSYYQPWIMHRKLSFHDRSHYVFDNLVYGIAKRTGNRVVNLESEQTLVNAYELLNTRYNVKWLLSLTSQQDANKLDEEELIVKYYLQQDTASIALAHKNGEYLPMQNMLIANRNEHWQKVIDQHMRRSNFIYCGLAHVITGELSLLKYFSTKQYSVRAIDIDMGRLP